MNQCNGKECNGCVGYTRCRMFWRETIEDNELDEEFKPYFSNEPLPVELSFELSFKEMYDRVRSVCQQAGLDNTTITRVTFLEDGGYEVQIGIEASPDNWHGRRVPDPHTVDGISISYYIIGEE